MKFRFLKYIIVSLGFALLLTACTKSNDSNNVTDTSWSETNTVFSNNQTSQQQPFTINGNYPETVKAGEPFAVSLSIKNNTDIPIIACNLELINMDMVETIDPESGWSFYNNSLSISNVFIRKNQSLDTSFNLLVMNPGSYQFKIQPQIKAGDWFNADQIVISFQVQDMEQAQKERSIASTIQQNNNTIESLNDTISSLTAEIEQCKYTINSYTEDIQIENKEIASTEREKQDSPQTGTSVYDGQIQMHNDNIKDKQSEISQCKTIISVDTQKISSLNGQKNDLLSQNQKLQNQ